MQKRKKQKKRVTEDVVVLGQKKTKTKNIFLLKKAIKNIFLVIQKNFSHSKEF